MKKTALFLSMLLSAVLLPATPALADSISLTLSNPIQTGTSGATLTFTGTVSADPSNTNTIYLNGDSANLSLAGSSIDDTDFLLNFPLSLDPGAFYTDAIFTVTLPTLLAPGDYTGYFSILGGLDPNAQNTLSTASFEVSVPSSVPEPGTWALFGTGMAAIAITLYTRRKSTAAFMN